MSRGYPAIPALLGGVAIATLLWQNHVVAARMAQLADRIDALAAQPASAPMIRTVTAAAVTVDSAAVPVKPVEQQARQASAEQQFVAAERRADDIISSGNLTPENILELRANLTGLSRAEAFEIRRRLIEALNTDRLVATQLPFELP